MNNNFRLTTSRPLFENFNQSDNAEVKDSNLDDFPKPLFPENSDFQVKRKFETKKSPDSPKKRKIETPSEIDKIALKSLSKKEEVSNLSVNNSIFSLNERPRNETRGRRPEPINSKVHFLTDPENENQATLSPSFSIVDDHHVIMIEKQPIALQFLGKGNFHKVWRGIEDKSHLVIKLWLGGLDPKTKEESYKDTLQAYQLLNQQADQYKDFRVSRLINRETIRRDGFYVYEYIQGEKPKFNDVKGLFQKMIDNPLRFIADFRPDNVKIQDGQVVIIDPSIEKGFMDGGKAAQNLMKDKEAFVEEFVLHMSTMLLSWTYDENNTVKPELLEEVLKIGALMSEETKFIWKLLEEKIKELADKR